MPGADDQKAWQWYDPTRYDKGMMFSILPVDPSEGGLASDEEIIINAQAVEWADSDDWTAPTYPDLAEDPISLPDG